ncbi:hypothetical protein [Streptomyces sp. NPDC051657]|uniref:hypothetical protein n=1 Tax=unclassified Streptomyces TaxID=2593676 RepID=UPI0034411DF7
MNARCWSWSRRPVWMSEYFPVLNPAEPGMDENHPGHEAWTERQMAWYGVSISLWRAWSVSWHRPTAAAATWSSPPAKDVPLWPLRTREPHGGVLRRPGSGQGDVYHRIVLTTKL